VAIRARGAYAGAPRPGRASDARRRTCDRAAVTAVVAGVLLPTDDVMRRLTRFDKPATRRRDAFRSTIDGRRHTREALPAHAPIAIVSPITFEAARPLSTWRTDRDRSIRSTSAPSSPAKPPAAAAARRSRHPEITSRGVAERRPQFSGRCMRLAGQAPDIGVVDDQWGAPTFAVDLPRRDRPHGDTLRQADRSGCRALSRGRRGAKPHGAGARHLGRERRPRRLVVDAACQPPAPRPASTRNGGVGRPANSRLDCGKARASVRVLRRPAGNPLSGHCSRASWRGTSGDRRMKGIILRAAAAHALPLTSRRSPRLDAPVSTSRILYLSVVMVWPASRHPVISTTPRAELFQHLLRREAVGVSNSYGGSAASRGLTQDIHTRARVIGTRD